MLSITLQTPFKKLFQGEVKHVSFQTTAGAMQVYPNHAPLAAVIDFSEIRVNVGSHEEVFTARHGTVFMHTKKNKLHILVEHCEKVGDVKYESIADYLNEVRKMLRGENGLSGFELAHLKREEIAASKMLRMIKK